MQTQGSLRDGGLSALLQTMQSERATGTLALDHDGESASLYFLFGHLFHASGGGGQGEDVVIRALGWDDGQYQFDPRAKLPAEETIKSSPAELLSAAQSRQGALTEPVTSAEPAWAGNGSGQGGFGEHEPAVVGGGYESAAAWGSAQHDVVAAPSEPLAYPTPASPEPEPELAPAPVVQSQQRQPSPQPSQASRQPLGARQEQSTDIMYPLPSGRPHYEGLKSAFVDFPRLLRTLRSDRHTGYIRLSGSSYSGIILLNEGQVLEAVCSNGAVSKGEAAFQQVRRHMDAGDGMLDVVELDGTIVVAVSRMFTAPLLYTGLLGRFVNLDALLEYLGEEKVDGALVVTGSSQVGAILLGQGNVLGAYTEQQRDLDSSTGAVAKLAGERTSRIEVKSGSGSLASIDVDNTLTKPY